MGTKTEVEIGNEDEVGSLGVGNGISCEACVARVEEIWKAM